MTGYIPDPPPRLLPGTIASAQALAGVTLSGPGVLLPGTIASAQALAGVTMVSGVAPGSIASAEALAGVTLSGPGTILLGTIASAQVVVGAASIGAPTAVHPTATPVPLPGSRFSLRVEGWGTVTELADWLDDAEFTLNDQGGYETASLQFHALPEFALPELRPGRTVRAFLDDREIWRGRTEELSKWPHTLSCTGPWAYLNDFEGFRAVLLDSDLGQWRTDMQHGGAASRFQVENTGDGISFYLVPGTDYKAGESVRVVYMPYDGLPPAMPWNAVSQVRLGFQDDGTDPSLYALRLVGLTGPYGSPLGIATLSPGGGRPGTRSRIVNVSELDPGLTFNLRALALELVVVNDFTYLGSFGAPGGQDVRVPDIYVFHASVLGVDPSVLGVTGNKWAAHAPPEKAVQTILNLAVMDAPDYYPSGTASVADGSLYSIDDWRFEDSGLTVEQLAWRDIPRTAADAIRDVDAMLNWQYGVQDESGLHYRKPWTAENVPAARCWYASFYAANGEPQIVPSFADTCSQTVGVYTDGRGITRQASTVADSRTLGSYLQRTHVLPLSENVTNAAQAQTAVNRYQADHSEGHPNGTWRITGGVRRLCDPPGVEHPACFIAPGDFLFLPDAPAGYPRKVRITRVTRRPLAATADVEVGLNPRRLEAYLARLQNRAHRRRR